MHACRFHSPPSKAEMVGRLQGAGELGATWLLGYSPGEFQVSVVLKKENLEVHAEKQPWLLMMPTGRKRAEEQKGAGRGLPWQDKNYGGTSQPLSFDSLLPVKPDIAVVSQAAFPSRNRLF